MNDLKMVDAATSLVLGLGRTGEAACARRTVPPVVTVQGTGLPIGGPSHPTLDRTRLPFAGTSVSNGTDGIGGVMGADQVKATVVRIPADADPGVPPPRTPSRC